ncbi:MAG: UPF0489 family protein [Clostridia bacterium]|nr:UPF0489 family protein [Clostridia bacterium]
MRVLDIDLDFFLSDCFPLADIGKRPDIMDKHVWKKEDVRTFLELNCGLSCKNKIPGRVFETHDGALCFWGELIKHGRLKAPFSVVHIDAHSDLGIGYPGPGFVLNSVLGTKPFIRADIERYYRMRELDEANYLLFALAFRWIDRLVNVRNPKSHNDIPKSILVDDGNFIQLRSFTSKFFVSAYGEEPKIQFKTYSDYSMYKDAKAFDFMSLAISPRYAPIQADDLISVICEYMCEI